MKSFLALLICATVSFGSEKLNYTVSWFGNSYPGGKAHIPQDIDSICVLSDGAVFSNVHWEEGGANCTMFKDGKVVAIAGHTHGWGNQGGYAVAANDKYLFISGRMVNEGGNLVDPETWPPKGFDWIGVSRRLLSDIRKPASFPTGKGGKGDTLKKCFLVVDEISNERGSLDDRFRNITGLLATSNRLYVSCPYANEIKIYDSETMEKIGQWKIERPGQIALDVEGTFWVLQERAENQEVAVLRINQNGEIIPPKIIFSKEIIPKSIAFTQDGKLLVADCGKAQQIRIYGNLNTRPTQIGLFGIEGGIFAKPEGRFGDLRFNEPSAIGCDSNGNIYVAHHGSTGGGSTILESYVLSTGKLNWRLFGLEFVDMADCDPFSEGDVYTKEEHFKLDYSKPAAQQWKYIGYTVNKFKYPEDPRLHIWSAGVWTRRIQNRLFLFVNDMNGERLQVYRFNENRDGETAIPSALYSGRFLKTKTGFPPFQPLKGEWLWIDLNGNGRFEQNEYITNDGKDAPAYQGWWVDEQGNIWQAFETAGIRKLKFKGLGKNENPQWDFSNTEFYSKPQDFNQIKRIRYYPQSDTMYLGGTTKEHKNQHWKPMGPVIARYDNWSTANRKLRWLITAPYEVGSKGHSSCEPMGFDVAGDYVFVPYTGASKAMKFSTGHIEVFKADTGEPVGYMEPSPEIGEIGLQDIRECLRAVKRKNGEYVIFLEEDYKAKILVYQWKP
ncbi:MAG: hypothetical protein ACP5MG_07635 [Verrucomicrobiia bacterium]|jgi:hypothetical protein